MEIAKESQGAKITERLCKSFSQVINVSVWFCTAEITSDARVQISRNLPYQGAPTCNEI